MTEPPATVGSLVDAAVRLLAGRSPTARMDAELLLAAELGVGRAVLRAHPERVPPPAALARFEAALARRAAGEPVAYVLGRKEFWSLELEVGPDVLVPRPETECLVELALARLPPGTGGEVLDLGTGSGAIGLAIAAERPGVRVCLTDVSRSALATAERNAERLGLGNVSFALGDWFGALDAADRFDVIVSNPPYLAADDPHLAAPELGREPRGALVAGPGGLEALAALIAGAPAHLRPGGWLLVEHGATQGPAVRALFGRAGLAQVATAPDLAGLDRVTLGRRGVECGPGHGEFA
jgi:release factor glutamine methyltransferase